MTKIATNPTEAKGLTKAILNVMDEVKSIDKNLQVGLWTNSYKGVSDKDVKLIIWGAMKRNGLIILPIDIEESVETNISEETYKGEIKVKTSRFTKVKVTYDLIHESGESRRIVGYGHGVDTQDKGAGKATTYALKYALLYTFLTPTGDIDDTDNTHSDDIMSQKKSNPQSKNPVGKPQFTEEKLEEYKKRTKDKNKDEAINKAREIKNKYTVSQEIGEQINLFLNSF